MIREAFQDLSRLREIAVVVARHGFGAYLERTRVWDAVGRREEPSAQPPPERGRATAIRFRQMLAELGPTFIKLGQVLSTRADILPRHWVEELAHLQDAVPPFPAAQARAEIERALGRSIDACFASLDEAPLASASIAQVHQARTLSGERVAVKVQRPDIRRRIDSDLALLYHAARLLEAVVEETGIYTPTGIVEEFDRAIHEELDFALEARNMREMREKATGRDYLVIPRVHEDLSAATVLTMEFIEGVKLNEVIAGRSDGFDKELLARRIIEASFRQLFEDGVFHGDPHPGNVLVLPDNRLALLDFGLVGRMTPVMQDTLVMLIVAIALKDPQSVARLLYRMGVPEGRTPLAAFAADIQVLLDRYLGLSLDQIRPEALVPDVLDLAVRHRIKVPKEYAVLGKASVAVEGIIRRLYPDLSVLGVGLPYAKELLLARLSPGDAGGVLMKSLLRIQTLAEDVPAQLNQILLDLEGGKLRINIESPQLTKISVNLRILAMTVFLGLMASSLTVGGFFVLSRYDWQWRGVPIIGVVALLGAGAAFGAAITWYLVAGRLRKISIQRWLKRPRR